MRVLHLAKLDPSSAGGIERVVRELTTAQRAAGHAVHVLASRVPASGASDPELTLLPCHGSLWQLPLSPGYPGAARRLLRRWRPDVVHLHWPNPWAALLPALPHGTRLVLHWHADVAVDGGPGAIALAYRLLLRRLERRLLTAAHAVVATSTGYARASAALAPWLRKVRVLPLGLGDSPPVPPDSAPAWPEGSGPRLLFVGRLVPYKGVDRLLAALARVPEARLLVLGDGPERRRLERLAAGAGLAPRVRFLGAAGEHTKLAALAACDLLCLPSLNRLEAFGLVLLEAARAGAPVLAADVPGSGIAEVLAGIDGARSIPAGDVGALAEALAATPARIARPPPDWRASRFHVARVAAAFDAVYDGSAPPVTDAG